MEVGELIHTSYMSYLMKEGRMMFNISIYVYFFETLVENGRRAQNCLHIFLMYLLRRMGGGNFLKGKKIRKRVRMGVGVWCTNHYLEGSR